MRPKKQKRSSNFQKVLEKILLAEPVYIKDSGIKVLITDIDFHEGQTQICGRVKFLDTPTKKVLLKCHQINIDVREDIPISPSSSNSNTNKTQYSVKVNAIIDLEHLSTTPYETRAAKILYKKA